MPGKTGKKEALIGRFGPFLLIPPIYAADRFFKAAILSRYEEGGGFAVIPGLFHITRVDNTGAAFGLFRDERLFLIAVSVLAVIGLAAALAWIRPQDTRDRWFRVAMALVAAGALGNLHDRVFYGYVLDFLDFRVWPVFNVADIAVSCGVAVMLVTALWPSRPRAEA